MGSESQDTRGVTPPRSKISRQKYLVKLQESDT